MSSIRADDLPTDQVYAILDEIFLAGEIEETSKVTVLNRLDQRTSQCEPVYLTEKLTRIFPLTESSRKARVMRYF